MNMKGVILAGGEGKRLRPVTLTIPKPLILVREKPLINYNLGLFARYGVNNIKVIIRPSDREKYELWRAQHGNEFPDAHIDLIEEVEPMGTFGYVFHHLRGWIGGENVFVTNGDDIKNIDLKGMLEFHHRARTPATLALMKMEKPDDYGVVLVRGDKITSFLEKQAGQPSGFVNAGMYIISIAALDHIAPDVPKEKKFLMFEKDLFPALAQADKLGAFTSEGIFYDCGTMERWEKAIRET